MTERFSDRRGYRADQQETTVPEDGWECEIKADERLPKRLFHLLDGVPAA